MRTWPLLLACASLQLATQRVCAQEDPRVRPQVFPGGYVMEPLAPASVENLGEGRVVTLDAVLRSVELHHPPLEAARERVDAAEGQRLAAEGAFDLSVQGRVSSTLLGYYQYALRQQW